MQRAFVHHVATSLCLALALGAGLALGAESAAAAPLGAPVLTVPGDQTVNEGALLSFTVSATDPEGQPVTLRVSGLPAGATFTDFHNNTGSFSWTPDAFQAGSYVVTFTADDSFGGMDTKSVSIQVLDVNNAPVLDPIGDRSVERGGFLSIMISGSDPDGDALSYSQTGMPSYGTFTDYGDGYASLTLAPPANEPTGTTSMTVTLSDGSLSTSETFSITVYAVGSSNAPVLAPIGNQTVAEGSTSSVSLSATDSDQDMLTWTVSLPGFASLTSTSSAPGSATARLDLAPAFCASGSYPATISVSDGALSASESFTITVSEVNRPPAWAVPVGGYTISMLEGGAADLSVRASDPDEECGLNAPTLSYLGAGTSTALVVTFVDQGGGTGHLNVAATFEAAGSHTLQLRAMDSTDPSVFADVPVQVTVAAVNRAPVASAGGPYAGLVGSPVEMSASGSSDPDGDALSFAWSFGDGAQGSGANLTHSYGAMGHYVVSLTASDGSLASTDTTGANISTAYLARAFMDPSSIKLFSGKPRESVYLEPIGGSFELSSVDLGTLTLTAPAGMGSVAAIHPVAGKTMLGGDRDHNNVLEIEMEFTKEDLRALFSNVSNKMSLTLVLSANLLGGGSVQASFGTEVWPERKNKLVRRVYPNPMNPEATISLTTARPGYVFVRVYDLTGRLVRTLMDEPYVPAGDYDVRFDGRDFNGRPLASGQYYYRVETPSERTAGSVTILK